MSAASRARNEKRPNNTGRHRTVSFIGKDKIGTSKVKMADGTVYAVGKGGCLLNLTKKK